MKTVETRIDGNRTEQVTYDAQGNREQTCTK